MGSVCHIGVGSNLDDPVIQVKTAFRELAQLPQSTIKKISSLYQSQPLGPTDQPDYINAVVSLTTALQPHDLLQALQGIEQKHQRIRKQHWGPRSLDLDILLYADLQLDSDRLVIPHAQICRRDFVLVPLAEIAPELNIPGHGNVQQCIAQLPQTYITKITPYDD